MTDKLREAAKWKPLEVEEYVSDDTVCLRYHPDIWPTNCEHVAMKREVMERINRALSEPEEPKVERVTLWVNSTHKHPTGKPIIEVFDPNPTSLDFRDGKWRFYAERPMPAKSKAEELADRLDKKGDFWYDQHQYESADLCKHAAAELRRKR